MSPELWAVIVIAVAVLGTYWGMKALWGDNYIRCPNCGYLGKKSHGSSGSLAVELTLWVFGIIGLLFFVLPGLIILLIAVIYGLSRKRYTKCPSCDWKHPAKMDRDQYLKLLAERNKPAPNQPNI